MKMRFSLQKHESVWCDHKRLWKPRILQLQAAPSMNANVSLSDNNILTPLNDFPKASNPPSLLRLSKKGKDPHLVDPIIFLLERFDDLPKRSKTSSSLEMWRISIRWCDPFDRQGWTWWSFVWDCFWRVYPLNLFTQFSLRRNNCVPCPEANSDWKALIKQASSIQVQPPEAHSLNGKRARRFCYS